MTIDSLSEVRRFVRTNLRVVGPDRWRLALLIGLSLLSGVVQATLLFLLAVMAVALSSRGPVSKISMWLGWTDGWSAAQLVGGASLCVVLVMFLSVPIAYFQAAIGARAVARARNDVVEAFLDASHPYRETLAENHIQQLIGEHCVQLANGVQYFTSFCVAATSTMVLLAMPIAVSSRLALLVVVLALLAFSLLGPMIRRIRQDALTKSFNNRDVIQVSFQAARMASEIQLSGATSAVAGKVSGRIEAASHILRRLNFTDEILRTLPVYLALAALCLAMGIFLLIERGPRPGLAVLVLLGLRILGYARTMLLTVQHGSAVTSHAEIVAANIAALRENRRAERPVTAIRFDGVKLTDLSYRLPDGRIILDRLNLRIQEGEALGIVGASGQGKSTLCSILVGLRAPSAGGVTVNEIAVSQIALETWSSFTAYVPQHSQLITASVADNIRFYRGQYDDAAVEAAARSAHIHEEITALPHGYATLIGPGARGLSGGQLQRLSIARALIGQPRFLVLDEPSSALDQRSEFLLGETLAELKGATTLVIISHRPAILEQCDRVLSLEQGHLVETRPSKGADVAIA